jgi:16S rRNA (guanine527-N7)-methyltransferase
MSSTVDSLAESLQAGAAALKLSLDEAQQDKLLAYVALLAKWNKVYNLTAVREPERMIPLHILDSLSIVPHVERTLRNCAPLSPQLLDVGAGGGLPGICVAIAAPELSVVMLDSIQKKTTFIQQAIGELGLANARVVCTRVEDFQPEHKFELVTSRAFAELSDFVAGAAHLVAPHGKMLAMKGVYPHDEIARLPTTHRATNVIELHVPQVDAKRHLVIIEKT